MSSWRFFNAENINQDTTDPHGQQSYRYKVSVILLDNFVLVFNVTPQLIRPELVNFPSSETVVKVVVDAAIDNYLCSEMVAPENDELYCWFRTSLWFWRQRRKRVLLLAGYTITNCFCIEYQLYKVRQSLDCFACNDMFDMLEKKYKKLTKWSRAESKTYCNLATNVTYYWYHSPLICWWSSPILEQIHHALNGSFNCAVQMVYPPLVRGSEHRDRPGWVSYVKFCLMDAPSFL